MSLIILTRGRRESPRMSKGKRVIECNIEHFVPMVAVTKQKAEDTMLDLIQPLAEGLEERYASS